MKSFDECVTVTLGPKASIDDFNYLGIDESPTFEKYEDYDHNGHMSDPPDKELNATPEVGDKYVNNEIMLPGEFHMAIRKVVCLKCDVMRNPIG